MQDFGTWVPNIVNMGYVQDKNKDFGRNKTALSGSCN
jgi:hypothetical protein